MYSTCLFCSSSLGRNETMESFPVGRRLAFDAARGRLWVVCRRCERWNLSPIEERWEAIEACEREYRATTVRASTDNIGLARLASGLELVRIGSPLRPEFAAWRYGRNLRRRRHRALAVAGAGAVGAVATGAVVAPVVAAAASLGAGLGALLALSPGITLAMSSVPAISALSMRDYLTHDRVVARFAEGRRVLTVRARHLASVEFHAEHGAGSASVEIPHDRGSRTLTGTHAVHATSVLLAGANLFGAGSANVQSAVRLIEDAGDAGQFLASASARNAWRGGHAFSMLNALRGVDALKLTATERLALEMAVHEETERRAMDGELAVLEEAWRDAEEIARIVDNELTFWPQLHTRSAGLTTGAAPE